MSFEGGGSGVYENWPESSRIRHHRWEVIKFSSFQKSFGIEVPTISLLEIHDGIVPSVRLVISWRKDQISLYVSIF